MSTPVGVGLVVGHGCEAAPLLSLVCAGTWMGALLLLLRADGREIRSVRFMDSLLKWLGVPSFPQGGELLLRQTCAGFLDIPGVFLLVIRWHGRSD